MELIVSKVDLVRELSLSQGVVEKKTTIPILSNVLLEASGDRVVMTATDLELGIRCSCPARVSKEGSGTIPAKRLLDYVRLLPDTDLTIKFAENQWASLLCGRSKTRIAGMSRDSFPELPQMPDVLAEIPIGILCSMIAKTIFAISMEESRFTLSGALLLLKTGGLTMVATDGHRLSMVDYPVELAGFNGSYRALLPRKAMLEILKLAQEVDPKHLVQFSGDDNHLFFRLGERLLISRKLTGNFPDFDRVLPKEQPYTVTLAREELRMAIERVAQFSDERSRSIRVQFGSGELTVHSIVSETGESEESLPIEYEGPTVSIGFNAAYLVDFLRAVSEPNVSFHFKSHETAGEMRPAGEDISYQYRYVVMPMRV
jgi:DNA polymerase III subunit beta